MTMHHTRSYLPAAITLFATLFAGESAFAQTDPVAANLADSTRAEVVVLRNAADALFSPSGRFLAVDKILAFQVFPLDSILGDSGSVARYRDFPGSIVAFLPPQKCIIGAPKGTFEFDLTTLTVRQFSDSDITKPLGFYTLISGEIIPLTDTSLISGIGSCEGSREGWILVYQLDGSVDSIPAPIGRFRSAMLSPDSAWVLYECGCGDTSAVGIYSVKERKNYLLTSYSAGSKKIPDLRGMSQKPVGWTLRQGFFLVSLSKFGPEGTSLYVAAFDASSRKLQWFTNVTEPLSEFAPVGDEIAIAAQGTRPVRIDLKKGTISPTDLVLGVPFGVSPDRSTFAYVADSTVYTVPADGGQPAIVAHIPNTRFRTSPGGYGFRPLLWSPRQDAIALFGSESVILIRVKLPSREP